MKKYTCLIVDDEKLARELLKSYVEKISYLELVGCCSTAIEAMQVIQEKQVDILLLDIQMPDVSGIELLKMLKDQPATIFTTAYSEFALEGFELEVVDYLIKPIEFDRFFKAISKAMKSIQNEEGIPSHASSAPTPSATPPTNNYFFVKSDYKIVKINFDDILYMEAMQKYIRIFTDKKPVTTLISLSKILESLPKDQFIRIHRSYIINIDKIDNIEGNMVRIAEQSLAISKGQREEFMDKIKAKGLF